MSQNHCTSVYKLPEELIRYYQSEDAPDYAEDGNTNLSINISPAQLKAIKQLSLDTDIPISYLTRLAYELTFGDLLKHVARRNEQ